MANFCLDECVCEKLRAWLHIWMLAMDWSVPNLQCFVHLVLSVVILYKCVCRVKLERELASERFPGERKKGLAALFSVWILYYTALIRNNAALVLFCPFPSDLCTLPMAPFFFLTPCHTLEVWRPEGNGIKSDTCHVPCPAVPVHLAAMHPPLASCHNNCKSGIENKAPPMHRKWQSPDRQTERMKHAWNGCKIQKCEPRWWKTASFCCLKQLMFSGLVLLYYGADSFLCFCGY